MICIFLGRRRIALIMRQARSLRTLREGQWLDDNVINMFLQLVQLRSKKDCALPYVGYLYLLHNETYG
jgi:Ulp1 family protease